MQFRILEHPPNDNRLFRRANGERDVPKQATSGIKIELAYGAQNRVGGFFAVTLPVFPRRNPNACRCRGLASTIGGMNPGFSRTAVCFFAVVLATVAAIADEPKKTAADPPAAEPPAAEPAATIVPTEYLVLPAVGQYGRLPLQRDAIEAQLVTGTWKEPTSGATLKTADGKLSMWNSVKAGDDGTLDIQKIRGGYAFATVDSPTERVMLLEAAGHAMVYVNGEPHTGDPYNVGWLHLPVLVKAGKNTLLFHLSGDKLKARLTKPRADVYFTDEDRIMPTAVEGELFATTSGGCADHQRYDQVARRTLPSSVRKARNCLAQLRFRRSRPCRATRRRSRSRLLPARIKAPCPSSSV